jgi:ABC-type glycerol-3-phosphate transport system substrate-binding protein
MSRRTLAIIVLAMVALVFAGTSAATAAAKRTKKKPVTRTVVRSPPQPLDTQTGSRSQGM